MLFYKSNTAKQTYIYTAGNLVSSFHVALRVPEDALLHAADCRDVGVVSNAEADCL